MEEEYETKLRCLEMYSGIGGMHCALRESGVSYEVVSALDINPVANSIYRQNFPTTRLICKCLTRLTVEEFDSFNADVVLLSPPCQPFTRVGRQRDVSDPRSQSLLHILSLLTKCSRVPRYVLVENVKGFETSAMRDELIRVLTSLDFQYQELLLSPTQFGIPNSRLRYYLLAKQRPLSFCFETRQQVMADVPRCKQQSQQPDSSQCTLCSLQSSPVTSLHQFLEPSSSLDSLAVPLTLQYKHFWTMDLVTPQSTLSCCFTKRYGRYIEGAGSIVQTAQSTQTVSRQMNAQDFQSAVESYHLRFFSPREVANLLCFPHHFELMEQTLSSRQLYQVLGNSINVQVLSVLIHLLVT